jgi:hypothetical protein
MKAYVGVEVKLHSFLTLALHVERSASQPGRFVSYEMANDTESRRLDWPQKRTLWEKQEIISPLGFEKERFTGFFLMFC